LTTFGRRHDDSVDRCSSPANIGTCSRTIINIYWDISITIGPITIWPIAISSINVHDVDVDRFLSDVKRGLRVNK
jgi:hypothetical protein